MYELERNFMNGQSSLELITGPMFSGKTEELIRRIRRVSYAKKNAIVFKPHIDDRYSLDKVVSHSAQRIDSIPVKDVTQIKKVLSSLGELHVVGFDEVNFFTQDIVQLCEELVTQGVRVIAAGLCEDYLCKPFGPMPEMLAHADTVTKLWAICMSCGQPASKTQRINSGGSEVKEDQVIVGASETYQARCRNCHKKEIVCLSFNNSDDGVGININC